MSENAAPYPACPFCAPDPERIFYRGELVLGLWDLFPVSEGHALLVTRRHVPTWFDASRDEQAELLSALAIAREAIRVRAKRPPDGFNIGVNVGAAAGQKIFHLHVHLIPRYGGNVDDPGGGVRYVIPSRAKYDLPGDDESKASKVADAELHPRTLDTESRRALSPLVRGEHDPFLPHLRKHLDEADRADLLASFALESGVRLLQAHLRELLDRGGQARILVGDYLDITEPAALLRLLDLQDEAPELFEPRIFVSDGTSFHPKAYLFRGEQRSVAYVGSSNLSEAALTHAIEWNYRIVREPDFAAVLQAFEELFHHPQTRPLTAEWIDAYRKRRPARPIAPPVDVTPEPPPTVPEPHEVQKEALDALARTRAEGNQAGLVVLATGLGKTWLSAFDTVRCGARRVLFVAHREEILRQARDTYRRIRPEATLGLYTGIEKAGDADVLFASIQTLGRANHLRQFGSRSFDYIVVDEFHHACARTYRRLIDHFEPAFLLGLTATPERTDGGDLLALCGENLVYRSDVLDGIERGLLSPFRYIGVPDEVDYSNIPWRSSRFDEQALTNAVATQKRARNALEQFRAHAGERTLAFCCSKRHADFMADFFDKAGVRAAAVHTGPGSAPRTRSLERLVEGELQVLFAVDIFNEGVDLPNVDTILMLRPTESRILWTQQFGRGLRRAPGKDHLKVVDYIGNHRTFLLKPQTLLNLSGNDREIAEALDRLQRGELELPPGCDVTYELEAINILKALLRIPREPDALKAWYESFKERHGTRPTALEAHHSGYAPRSLRKSHGSWLDFVRAMGDGTPAHHAVLNAKPAGDFLRELEKTQMTRSFKMLTLLAMLNADQLPGRMSIDELAKGFARLARRSSVLRTDVGEPLENDAALRRHLEANPINAWTGRRDAGGTSYFAYEDGQFRTTFDVAPEHRDAFQELARELTDWRLAEYLERPSPTTDAADGFPCKVSHANGRPILFLPDRDAHPEIPTGWTPISVDGQTYEANVVKVAVNVIRRPGNPRNELPTLMRQWFGPDAGLPGTNFQVVFRKSDAGWTLVPQRAPRGRTLELWESYSREQIPPLFGLTYTREWQSGIVWKGKHMILFVTLEKSGQPAQHRYEDRFLSPDTFQWQSQNRTPQRGKVGHAIQNHEKKGIDVHLFVRPAAKIDQRTAPFVYCGQLTFKSWQGEKPITVMWSLTDPLSERLHMDLAVS